MSNKAYNMSWDIFVGIVKHPPQLRLFFDHLLAEFLRIASTLEINPFKKEKKTCIKFASSPPSISSSPEKILGPLQVQRKRWACKLRFLGSCGGQEERPWVHNWWSGDYDWDCFGIGIRIVWGWDCFGISIGIDWGAAEAKKKGLEFTSDVMIL